jgi:CBS domain-containing protein
MSSPAIAAHPNAQLKDVLNLMLENKVERLPVGNDGNYLIGLISHGDILRKIHENL